MAEDLSIFQSEKKEEMQYSLTDTSKKCENMFALKNSN